MCQYCDERKPDASGMEMDGKHHLMRILIADGGHITVRADGLSVPAAWDTFKVNYCPMCGKPLNGSDNKKVRYVVHTGGQDMRWFCNEQDAVEICEDLVSEEYETVSLYRVRIEDRKTCQTMTVWE